MPGRNEIPLIWKLKCHRFQVSETLDQPITLRCVFLNVTITTRIPEQLSYLIMRLVGSEWRLSDGCMLKVKAKLSLCLS